MNHTKTQIDWSTTALGVAAWLKMQALAVIVSAQLPYKTGLLASFGTLLILLAPAAGLSRKGARRYGTLIGFLIALVMWADLLYWRYYHDLPSVLGIGQLWQLGPVFGSLLALAKPADTLLFIDVLLATLFINERYSSAPAPLYGNRRHAMIGMAALGLLGASCLAVVAVRITGAPLVAILDRPTLAARVGVVNYHLVDAWTARRARRPASAAEGKAVLSWVKERGSGPKGSLFGVAQGKNLIVVQVESLQGFVVGRLVRGKEITPNLNRLKDQSFYFPDMYPQTARGNTSDAEFMLDTSLFPLAQGAAFFLRANGRFNSLPNIIRREGYYAAGFHSYRPSFWNRRSMYANLGFDLFVSEDDLGPGTTIGMGLADQDFFPQVVHRLKALPRPFYAQVVTLSSHYPFDAFRDSAALRSGQSDKSGLLTDYLEAIHYADQALGAFMHDLDEQGLLKESVLVVYGDHPALPENERHALMRFLNEDPRSHYRWRLAQRIPLIIHLPDQARASTVTEPAGQIDLYPTLLGLLGITPEMPYMGRDLFDSDRNAGRLVVFRDGSFVSARHYYREADTPVAYDRRTGRRVPVNEVRGESRAARQALEVSDILVDHSLAEVLAAVTDGADRGTRNGRP